jgi:hypothetical protein
MPIEIHNEVVEILCRSSNSKTVFEIGSITGLTVHTVGETSMLRIRLPDGTTSYIVEITGETPETRAEVEQMYQTLLAAWRRHIAAMTARASLAYN